MRNITINHAGIGRWLVGPECRRVVESAGEDARRIYQSVVAKRSGELARSASVSTFIGGRKNDRWKARLTVGEGLQYGASHEFGTQHSSAARDLNQVLALLGRGS